jgi:drug/metabolite transporter (DMT)-like permease
VRGVAVGLIIMSAFLHATYNLMMKRSRDKQLFLCMAFLTGAASLTLLLLTLPPGSIGNTLKAAPFALGASLMYFCYQVSVSKAYEKGDVSLVYPLTMLSPIFISLWASILLEERLSLRGLLGIGIVCAGAYVIQLRRITPQEVSRPVRSILGDSAVQIALLAALFYSFGAISDKAGITGSDVLVYVWMIVSGISILFLMYILFSRRGGLHRKIQVEWPWCLLGGVVIASSFLSFRFGLKISPVSYAVPVRQSSILFGVLYGVALLKERFGWIRFTASCIIIIGIWLVSTSY